jgi:prolyl-tRNA synthetase
MRMSRLFGHTLREAPADAEMISHQLGLRAALMRQMAQGIYSYLPLGWRVIRRITRILREEMDAIGAQELLMPVVQPAELWQATGRYDGSAPGPVLLRFQDRNQHGMVLAMTHEEALADLARQEVQSYRQLPQLVYHIQTKYRDEVRARGGLVRVREFLMKDAYSLDADQAGLDAVYERIYAAYERIFERCGLEVLAVEASTGVMGGAMSHEFMMPHPQGEDSLLVCSACRRAANAEVARFDKGLVEAPLAGAVQRVATPGAATIAAVAEMLGVETRRTLKAVFYRSSEGEIVFAVIRGDLEVNEAKLSAALGGAELRAASADDLEQAGLVAGYASPMGVRALQAQGKPIRVVGDDSLISPAGFVAGANEPGYHLIEVNYPRDFEVDVLTDIALARDGDRCHRCRGALRETRAIEVGHVFKLGARYSEALGATFLDAEGRQRPIVMGSYGIGLGRLMACIIEQHHDEHGIIWPPNVAPFDVSLISLARPGSEIEAAADGLYEWLKENGFEVLYDDRDERAGVKFNDADLIGIPVRLTVSERAMAQGGVELKLRWEAERHLVPDAEIVETIARALAWAGALG